MDNCIGLDISKSSISVYIPRNKLDIEIENTFLGMKKLYSKLKKIYKKEYKELIFIYEPTGNYSMPLIRFCNQKEIRSFIINPQQFSNHSKALGQRVKSDKIDAYVLSTAIHLAKKSDIKVPEYNQTTDEIKELMGYYKFTNKQRVQCSNHLESLKAKNSTSYATKDLERRVKNLKDKEKKILKEIKDIVDNNPKLKEGFENITSMTGIAEIGGIVLLHLFTKYPNANQREITSLTGLDPIDKTSGTSIKTRSKISKAGSALVRNTLFLGALSAIRCDENFQIYFNRLKSKGKHTTLAQVAVMRKMIIIAHSLYKNNKKYDKEVYKKAAGLVDV